MRPLLLFLLVFGAALSGGAWLAWPLYRIINLFAEIDFSSAAKIGTQICGLLFSLLYLKYADHLDLQNIGLKPGRGRLLPDLGYGFAAGLIILAGLATGLFAFGIYALHGGREITAAVILRLLLGALLTGLAVALFEEIVFRGALLQGLRKQAGMNSALFTISLVYAAVHFINYTEPASHEPIGWLTGPRMFLPAYSQLLGIETLDAFLALFVLGFLLGLIRLRTGSLIQCIGVHAGIVAGVKLFRFFAEYRPENSFDYLVSRYDLRLGWLALFWLLVVTAGYFVYLHCKPLPKGPSTPAG